MYNINPALFHTSCMYMLMNFRANYEIEVVHEASKCLRKIRGYDVALEEIHKTIYYDYFFKFYSLFFFFFAKDAAIVQTLCGKIFLQIVILGQNTEKVKLRLGFS